jgi:hypothetical protein
MSSCVCHIVKENFEGENVFLVRLYASTRDLAEKKAPIDIYECHEVIVDSDTAKYIAFTTELEDLHHKMFRSEK